MLVNAVAQPAQLAALAVASASAAGQAAAPAAPASQAPVPTASALTVAGSLASSLGNAVGSMITSLVNPVTMTAEEALIRLDVIGASFDVIRAELLQESLRMEAQVNPSGSDFRPLSGPLGRLKNLATIRELNHLPRKGVANIAKHIFHSLVDLFLARLKATLELFNTLASSCMQLVKNSPPPMDVQAALTRCEYLERQFNESRQRFQTELNAMAASPLSNQPHVMNRINRANWHLAGYRIVIHSLPAPQ